MRNSLYANGQSHEDNKLQFIWVTYAHINALIKDNKYSFAAPLTVD